MTKLSTDPSILDTLQSRDVAKLIGSVIGGVACNGLAPMPDIAAMRANVRVIHDVITVGVSVPIETIQLAGTSPEGFGSGLGGLVGGLLDAGVPCAVVRDALAFWIESDEGWNRIEAVYELARTSIPAEVLAVRQTLRETGNFGPEAQAALDAYGKMARKALQLNS